MLGKVGSQLISKDESPDEPCAKITVEACKLPPAGTGEFYLYMVLALIARTAFLIARNHKSDLPLNPETATEAQLLHGQTAGTAIPDTGACYLNRVLPCF